MGARLPDCSTLGYEEECVSVCAMRGIPKQTNRVKNSKSKIETRKLPKFVRGQKWQMARGHAEIVQVGKTLVHYRFLKTGMVRGTLEMKSIPHFAEAMETNKAKLLK
jgi:hypothetical protein